MPRKLLDMEEDKHGLPILPETAGWKRGEQQHVIRSFLTQHYSWSISLSNIDRSDGFTGMCMGTENIKAAVPWGDLIKNQSDFFEGTYWPAEVKVVEPSKIDKAAATALLDFWYDRQKKKLHPTFCFKAWKDTDGDMEPAAKTYQKVIRRSTGSSNKAKQALKHLQSFNDTEDKESTDEEAGISDYSREPPAKSNQKVTHLGSRRTKAHHVSEESLDEREEHRSSDDVVEAAISDHDREPPTTKVCTRRY